jgi:hypothetical protein
VPVIGGRRGGEPRQLLLVLLHRVSSIDEITGFAEMATCERGPVQEGELGRLISAFAFVRGTNGSLIAVSAGLLPM